MSRRLLQIINGVVGLVTVGLGTVQMFFGVSSPLYAPANGFTILEVIGAPLLVYWQHQVAVSAAGTG